jgi:hypothetical protein
MSLHQTKHRVRGCVDITLRLRPPLSDVTVKDRKIFLVGYELGGGWSGQSLRCWCAEASLQARRAAASGGLVRPSLGGPGGDARWSGASLRLERRVLVETFVALLKLQILERIKLSIVQVRRRN